MDDNSLFNIFYKETLIRQRSNSQEYGYWMLILNIFFITLIVKSSVLYSHSTIILFTASIVASLIDFLISNKMLDRDIDNTRKFYADEDSQYQNKKEVIHYVHCLLEISALIAFVLGSIIAVVAIILVP